MEHDTASASEITTSASETTISRDGDMVEEMEENEWVGVETRMFLFLFRFSSFWCSHLI